MKNIKVSLPNSWSLVEQYNGNYIFENSDKSFCVNVDYTFGCDYPYSISYIQVSEKLIMIGIENGAYSAHSKFLEDALSKAYEMMLFINSKCL